MKLTVAPLLCCLLIPAAYADDNGGLKKILPLHRHMRWMMVIVARKMPES